MMTITELAIILQNSNFTGFTPSNSARSLAQLEINKQLAASVWFDIFASHYKIAAHWDEFDVLGIQLSLQLDGTSRQMASAFDDALRQAGCGWQVTTFLADSILKYASEWQFSAMLRN